MLLEKRKKNKGMFPAFSSFVENFFGNDDFFGRDWFEFKKMPAVNVKELDDSYMVEVAAPGMKKEDFKIEINERVLMISSESKVEKEETDENYTRKEFNYSTFNRSFWLPEDVKEKDIKAEYKEGLLTIMIPKLEVGKTKNTKTIEIS